MGQWEEQRDEIFSLSRLVFCCVSSRPLAEGRRGDESSGFSRSQTAAEVRHSEKVHPEDAEKETEHGD